MESLSELIGLIRPADASAMAAAQARLDSLIKPIGSLGKLEELSVRLAGVAGTPQIPALAPRRVAVFIADHGVYEEGVAAAPQSTTLLMARAMAAGKSGMTVLAREAGADWVLVDLGMATRETVSGVRNEKLMYGTENIRKGPAMRRETAEAAILKGAALALEQKEAGMRFLGCGELGMANTTPASAMLAAFTGLPVEEITGRGAGLTDEAYANKIRVIRDALAVNAPDPSDPLEVLARVGGLDIAGMVGFDLGCAAARLPVAVDGFISAVAALTAYLMCPAARDFMFLSHASAEPGYAAVTRRLGLSAPLAMDMRLGEGSGCPLLFHLADAALAVSSDMALFEEAGIDGSLLVDIRK